jgi:hypothetical protein
MLKVPEWRTFQEQRVTVYQDDTLFWKFYLIPNYVTIRKDEAGKPVFLLVAYAFGDQDREEQPDLPRGGGYMVLDVEMRVEPEHETVIKQQLQKDVDKLWNDLKDLAEQAGHSVQGYSITSSHNLPRLSSTVSLGVDDVLLGLGPDRPEAPPGDAPPKVILASPTWVEGTFTVSAPQSTHLVSNRVAAGKLSLVGTNVASANLDLTSAGADFMVQTLIDPQGTGATDLTPIQVTYNLKFVARVPPVSVVAVADMRSVYMAVKGVFHDFEGGGCDEDSISHSEQNMEMAVSSGLVDLKVDVGWPDVPEDLVTQMRSDAMKSVQDALAARLANKQAAPAPAADDPTKDLIDSESDVNFLKTEASVDFSHFEHRETMSSTRKQEINPQGTLQGFLHDLSPQEVRQYVRKIDLNDPFFQTLNLKAWVFGIDWEKDPIDFVELEFDYRGTDENGQAVVKATTAIFTKEEVEFEWDPSLIGAKRDYRVRSRIGYRGHEPSEWTAWENKTTNRLSLSITPPGKLDVTFRVGDISFDSVTKSVQVEVEYEDSARGVPKAGTMFKLDAATAEKNYTRWIFKPLTKPVRFRPTFFLKNGQTVVGDWQETSSDAALLNEPRSENRLDVLLVPSGRSWAQVVQSVVTVRYADPQNDIAVEAFYQLKSLEEFKQFAAYLARGAARKFEYQVVTTFKDGSSEQSGWLPGDGDSTVQIKVAEPPELTVEVLPMLVDFAITPVVEVGLRYDDEANAIHASETFALTAKDKQTWSVPLADPAKTGFKYKLTYNCTDGSVVERPEEDSPDSKVTVQRLIVPEVVSQIIPRLIDFVATPVVEVNIGYVDPTRGVNVTRSFNFTEPAPQEFRLQVDPQAPRDYSVEIVYFLADGEVVTRPAVTISKTQIIIPKHVAAA